MYDKLIKKLRECTAEQNGEKTLWHQAADAIEELQVVVDGLTAQTNMVFEKTEGRTVIKFEPKWIPVTERLPEESGSYLIVDGRIVMEGLYEKDWVDCPWTDPGEMYMTYHPSHWMPLPQPPESEGE